MSQLRRSSALASFEPTRRNRRESFSIGFVHALEYGVASADLKPSIPWARSRFL
jgi:hypothetical protein